MPLIRRRRPKKKPKPIGRPPHKPTDVFRRQVLEFKGMGMTHDQIGKMIGVSDETLRKHYDYELNIADAKMNVNVANNLYTMATDPEHKSAVTAAIFWLKTRGGDPWREIKRTELTGKDGKPLSGAAKSSFVKKCKAEACEGKAIGKDGKPLSGAAKNSFIQKCEADA